ncbi:MAG: DUF711 family protein [Sulfolobales archaeon]
MVLIRSITLHIPEISGESVAMYKEVLDRFVEKISLYGYNVWSRRISLPPLESNPLKVCDELSIPSSRFSNVFIAAFNIDLEKIPNVSAKDLVSCMIAMPNTFSSLVIRDGDREIVFLEEFYSYGAPEIFTRFAGVLGGWVLTPYFPASASIVEEPTITISLRYVDLFDKAFTSREEYKNLIKWLSKLYRLSLEISEEIGIRIGGIDLSLSPWMSESVGDLIERYSGSRIGEPGSARVILDMNRFITRIAEDSGVKTTGFNEVMLPLEEDDLLKKRASRKEITLTTLLRLTPYCIAGVDMIVVSRRRLSIRNLVRDLMASYEVKRKKIGFRIIPVDREPGEKLDLGRFGEATVVDI